ncbi:glycoside hydrolase family 15 protein [Actinomadura scrupuli]|uniref:glycoside hydrolase family 15 protein n=1 Tax=Actinomadura scrupuli TaxID=559629 RepID=UPI003D97B0AF
MRQGLEQTPRLRGSFRIEDLGVLSDRRTTYVVAPDGRVLSGALEADKDTFFSGLLGGLGHFRVAPVGVEHSTSFGYVPGTNVLETTWVTSTGVLKVRDALEWTRKKGARRTFVREVICTEGSVEVTIDLEPVPDYGRTRVPWTRVRRYDGYNTAVMEMSGQEVTVASGSPLEYQGSRAKARFTLKKGKGTFVALSWGQNGPPTSFKQAQKAVDRTVRAWRDWLATGDLPDTRWKPETVRDALTLYGLCHEWGGVMAAATTSLPETLGGSRNWDYRFTWLRDGCMTVSALWRLGYKQPARDFLRFVVKCFDTHGKLQIMYGLHGETQLDEVILDHLPGYEGSSPVRIGNDAYDQQQNDMWGQVIVLVHLMMSEELDEQTWAMVISLVEFALEAADDPDCGIWEIRGEPKRFTSSRLFIWLALQRGADIAAFWGDRRHAKRWAEKADSIKADIFDTAVGAGGYFTIAPGDDNVDASCLLLLTEGFIQPDDPAAWKTVEAIAEKLADPQGFLERYQAEAVDDGLGGQKEGSFILCSFWLVQCWRLLGEHERAEELLAKLQACRGRTGLLAEMSDRGRQLGNVPQAFSHLGALNAVCMTSAAE